MVSKGSTQKSQKPSVISVLLHKTHGVHGECPLGCPSRGSIRRSQANALRSLLEVESYRVETASDGFQALRRVQQEPLPDLILLDVSLIRTALTVPRSPPRVSH